MAPIKCLAGQAKSMNLCKNLWTTAMKRCANSYFSRHCLINGIPYCSTEHIMSTYLNVCLMMVTVTETRSKLYIIEYIVVFDW